MRAAGEKDRDPMHLGEPWPKQFLPLIEATTGRLQREYDELVWARTGLPHPTPPQGEALS